MIDTDVQDVRCGEYLEVLYTVHSQPPTLGGVTWATWATWVTQAT